ncbi:ankyrin repeat-containing domain protein [Obelidium mucronatum]|nr:ankyrin repeat-containing domain protein [Obelidium mucronatum]
MHSFPSELIQEILMNVPLDSSQDLINIALASKILLAPFILFSPVFATSHIRHQMKKERAEAVWRLLGGNGCIRCDCVWGAPKLLPNYQNALYKEVTRTKSTEKELPNFALHWASKRGHTHLVKLLLQDPDVQPQDLENRAFKAATHYGHFEIVKLLLGDSRVDPTVSCNYGFRFAAFEGHLEIVNLLLTDSRVDPSDHNNTAIAWACQRGHLEVVKVLLAHDRVDPLMNCNLALRLAVQNRHLDVIKLLMADERVLNNGMDIVSRVSPCSGVFFKNLLEATHNTHH